ncbi:bifunctional diaminohydroxyphosphoribosylaminopyrimidine deaminase/5-amino-6-(5-phosphoribosylamino)uracil reductase RibD [Micromonospora sp. WMMD1102]|uniref:bifunctional diaminohydroxyphosphoribosylaminopyrimidine deaminase/5-amino-6-(5-phosphoribosylamino)uracil reductase RibD n=1 Tax=Micromonospora sp. WMMD1102 TaxID=3016105 RepID=UPI002415896D|nr:bifunctional diaminohydroxyphosphoribosylaminopyrimidine deaminase/5-amino-6-(5-phosphoribosylamino)uracil reductase RibD [Micromonospora sp. WMMD1102]MDG4784978.1 bifunctional diaminohydroxyphosphoribosylaminopyrimidine deaminase/5-amino-6-(5-phosphoribosylamino)uracil reductase RibD [Micromonospora sp. WMMD1102]
MASNIELAAMRHAIALSAMGIGTTSPNPPVGCVILNRQNAIVGRGFHRRKGEAHAEVHALAEAGPAARGGTAVVTLEPCNHIGVTPACRQELIDAGIARVVISVIDPTSRGDGGASMLAAAGIDVETDVLRNETLAVLGPWLTATLRRRPHLIWAYALDDDHDNSMTRQLVRDLRARADVVLANRSPVEGVPGGHSVAHFTLPEHVDLDTDLMPWLTAAYATGARSLLLAGCEYAGMLRHERNIVDELVIAVRRTSSSPMPNVAGFEIVDFWAGLDSVRVRFRQAEGEEM